MKVFQVQHYVGMGPLESWLFATLELAQKSFSETLKTMKKQENYDKEFGMSVGDPTDFERERGMIRKAHWQTWSESNTENGHEFYEDEEMLSLTEVEVIESFS